MACLTMTEHVVTADTWTRSAGYYLFGDLHFSNLTLGTILCVLTALVKQVLLCLKFGTVTIALKYLVCVQFEFVISLNKIVKAVICFIGSLTTSVGILMMEKFGTYLGDTMTCLSITKPWIDSENDSFITCLVTVAADGCDCTVALVLELSDIDSNIHVDQWLSPYFMLQRELNTVAVDISFSQVLSWVPKLCITVYRKLWKVFIF